MRPSQVAGVMVPKNMVSKIMLPAIWLAKVDVREVTKNAKRSLVTLGDLKLLDAADCNGEMRIRNPTIDIYEEELT